MDYPTSEFVSIIFTDISNVGSIRKRIGEKEAYARIADTRGQIGNILKTNGSYCLRENGGTVLGFSRTADRCLAAAVGIRDYIATTPFDARIGMNCGWTIPFNGDIYGDAVNLAARVKGLAEPNEIVITEEVYRRLSPGNQERMQLFEIGNVKGKSQRIRFFHLADEEENATLHMDQTVSHESNLLELEFQGRTHRFETSTPEFSIGRNADNDLVWEVPLVSRYHAVITTPSSGRNGESSFSSTPAPTVAW